MDEKLKVNDDGDFKIERLKERLGMTLAFSKRYQMSAAVCYLRIHIPPEMMPYKNHQVVSVLLQKMVTRLKNSIREIDTVIEVNQTDFVIILTDITEHYCRNICERIIGVVSEPFTVDFHQITVGSNIGICLYPYGTENAEELLLIAKVQMYEAERDGENSCSLYTGKLDPASHRKMLIENDLPYALKKGQLEVQFQPQYSLTDKRVTGVEALIRWNHPSLGIISPGEFIDYAEEAGVMNRLFFWILEQTCKKITAWKNDQSVKVSINLAVNQLLLDHFLTEITKYLAKYSVQAGQITFEITENIKIYTLKIVNERLHSLKELGFSIALDDFGNGYFSFSDFLKLPLDYIKLDRNFVSSLMKDKKHIGVISPIIQMAHHLGLQVIIEGIEEQSQFMEWAGLGCDFIQGYYISRPIRYEDLADCSVKIEKRIQDGS
ncbi:putative bifunctional diguanylate cyclase/phosphodiesterase [Bacillus sp. USDA818B3_A]|uniref:putative bifunctional diguanylate cyclase/phosphodiesterase n=1 Tax=Bacillus sp. USDA818B3_A TaxID=2698834 RepID=UPI001369C034|nr:phosphodiesterase [Bacillus sp. USDA818B3_A]